MPSIGEIADDPLQALRVELLLIDDAGNAVRKWGDDAIGSPGHPPRVGRAPEYVVRVKVESQLPCDVMDHDRLVHVDGALKRAGGAAGEMKERMILRIGRLDRELWTRMLH